MADAPMLKSRTVIEIMDASFRLYRENFLLFLGVLAVAYVPVYILQDVLFATMVGGMLTTVPATGAEDDPEAFMRMQLVQFSITMGMLFLLLIIAMPLSTGAITKATGGRYLNRRVTIGSSYGAILPLFFRLLLAGLVVGLVVGLGMMLCIIPGIIFAVWFVFTSIVCVLEDTPAMQAMGRSRELSKGHSWRIVGLGALMFLFNLVLSWSLSFGTGFALPMMIQSPVTLFVVSSAIEQVGSLIVMPFFSIAWVLLYYDIRIRKEAFDLEVLAKSMGSAPEAPAP